MRSIRAFSFLLALTLSAGCQQPDDGDDDSSASAPLTCATEATEGSPCVVRDEYGVPHIYAVTAEDLFFAFGHAQAEDHLEQMLRNYRLATGRLAAIDGESALGSDQEIRTVGIPRFAQANYDQLGEEGRVAVEAFAAGINRYMEQADDVPEWAEPVQPHHVVAFGMYMNLSRAKGSLQNDLANFYGGTCGEFRPDAGASNEWVVGPSLTESGAVYVQSDPHLPFTGTSAWYEAHLSGVGYDVMGATGFGLPGIIMGHNDRVAWTMTANVPDLADLWLLELDPANALRYRTPHGWAEAEEIVETIEVAGDDPVELVIYETDYGPLIDTDGETWALTGSMVLREDVGLIDQMLEMNRAGSADELLDAVARGKLIRWNIAYGDADGSIGYVYNYAGPLKDESYDWTCPVLAADPDAQHQGPYPFEDLPQERDPAAGFLQNCNDSPNHVNPSTTIGDDYPLYVVPNDGFGWRGRRATELLEGGGHSAEDLRAVSQDDYVMSLEDVVVELPGMVDDVGDQVTDPQDLLQTAVDAVMAWDLVADLENRALALVVPWVRAGEAAGLSPLDVTNASVLTDEQKIGVLEALVEVAEANDDNFGQPDPAWEEVHLLFRGERAIPATGTGGSLQPLHMATCSEFLDDGRCSINQGSSYMMLTELGDPVRAWSSFPLSENQDPDSPHFDDVSELWAAGQYKEAWFGLHEVEAHAESDTLLALP